MNKILLLLTFIVFQLNAQTNPGVSLSVQQSSSICNTSDCTTLLAEFTDVKSTTNYNVTAISYVPYSYSFPNAIAITTDDTYAPAVALPFNFCFYGNIYNSIYIGENGVVSFSTPTSNFCPWSFNATIPNATFPIKNSIYGVYQDALYSLTAPNISQISYQVIGTAPNRKMVINFKDFVQYQCNATTGSQTSQIVLHETSNIIDINVQRRVPCTTWQNGVGLIGIQNTYGTLAAVPAGRNTGNWTANNESWRFSPNGPSVSTQIGWFINGVAYSNSNPITLCGNVIDENSAIEAIVTYSICGQLTTLNQNVISPVIAQPAILEPGDLTVCNDINYVDLTLNNSIILNGLSPNDYEFNFFQTFADASNSSNLILNPTNYFFTNGQLIYVGIYNLISGCIYIKTFHVYQAQPVPPPTGISPQTYSPGQTLADLIVNGTNILWYDAATGGNLLPSSTVLQNGVTYYASQTTNDTNCESRVLANRLAITAQQTLNNILFNNGNLIVYPNPTKDNLLISSKYKIDSIEVYNTIGQKVESHKIDSLSANLKMNEYSNGIYFVKVFSQNNYRIIKIIKE